MFIERTIVALAAIVASAIPAAGQSSGHNNRQASLPSTASGLPAAAPPAARAGTFLKDNPAYRRLRLQPLTPRTPRPGAGAEERAAATIWNQYGGMIEALSSRLSVQPAAAVAVIAVESGGKPFEDGRPVIRFEIHCFWKHWGQSNQNVFERHFRYRVGVNKPHKDHQFRESPGEPWMDVHDNGQTQEWKAFLFAQNLDRAAAVKSASWGMGQILGTNYDRLGYRSPEAMAERFSDPALGPHMQILGVFDYVFGGQDNSPALIAFRNRDWSGFARLYNGTEVAVYAERLRRYHAAATRVLHP